MVMRGDVMMKTTVKAVMLGLAALLASVLAIGCTADGTTTPPPTPGEVKLGWDFRDGALG